MSAVFKHKEEKDKMEFKELQEKVAKIFSDNLKRDKLEMNDDYIMLKLAEELGEVVQSYIVHKQKCRPEKCKSPEESKKEMSKELADVVGMTFVIAKEFNIDFP